MTHMVEKLCPECNQELMAHHGYLACRGLHCTYREPLPVETTQKPSGAIKIPRSVGVCPECGATVYLEIEEDANGVPTEAGCFFTCSKSDDSHYHQPYVDWLPWEIGVYRWIKAHIRIRSVPSPTGDVLTTQLDGQVVRTKVTVEYLK